MAKKLKLGSQIVSLSDEAFSGISRPGQTTVSPYQSALQGQSPDQAKMAGSSAQTTSTLRKIAAPPTDTLRSAIRSRKPSGPTAAQGADLSKAARVDEALAGVFVQQMTLAKVSSLGLDEDKALAAGYNPQQLKSIKPIIDKLLANESLTAQEDTALRNIFQNDPNYTGLDSIKDIAANLIQEPDDALTTALKEQIRSGKADFTFSSIPESSLNKILLEQGLAEKGPNNEIDYSYIEDVLGPNWKNMSYADWLKEVTKRRQSFTDVKQLQLMYSDPQLSPAARAEVGMQLQSLGYTGVLSQMEAAERLEVDARNGYTLTVGGVDYPIDEIMDGLVLEGVVGAALGAGPGSEEWNNLEPELKAWLDENYHTVKAQYETTTGMLATGLGEGLKRADVAAAREELRTSLVDQGYANPEFFLDALDPDTAADTIAKFNIYADVRNGIISKLKTYSNPEDVKRTVAGLQAVLDSGSEYLIRAILQRPTTHALNASTPGTQVDSVGMRILREISFLPPEQRNSRVAYYESNAKAYYDLYYGSVEDFASTILGVDDAATALYQLNAQYQNLELSPSLKADIKTLDYTGDGQITMEDMKELQKAKAAETRQPRWNFSDTFMEVFGMKSDSILAKTKESAKFAQKQLGKWGEEQEKKKEYNDSIKRGNDMFDTLISGKMPDLNEFNIKVPDSIKQNYAKAYAEQGIEAATKVYDDYIASLKIPEKRAAKEAETARVHRNTGIFNDWISKYETPEVKARLDKKGTPPSSGNEYQDLLTRTMRVLRESWVAATRGVPKETFPLELERKFNLALKAGTGAESVLTEIRNGLEPHLKNYQTRQTAQRALKTNPFKA